ncbi:MAG: hypothetical protein V3U43_05380 [Pseudomonadales bacterium]
MIEHVAQVEGLVLLRAAVQLLEQCVVGKKRVAAEGLQAALPFYGMAGSAKAEDDDE